MRSVKPMVFGDEACDEEREGGSGQISRALRQGGWVGRQAGKKIIMGFYQYARTRSQGLLVLKYDHV
jgi:hypothetical protein